MASATECCVKKESKRELLLLLFLEAIPDRKGWISFHISSPVHPPHAVPGAQQILLCQSPAVLPILCPLLQSAAGCGDPSPCAPLEGFWKPWAAQGWCAASAHPCGDPIHGHPQFSVMEKPSRSGLSCRNHPDDPCSSSHSEPVNSSPCASLAEHHSHCRRRDKPGCLDSISHFFSLFDVGQHFTFKLMTS